MLVLTSEERHEQAWRAAHEYPLLTHEALFVMRLSSLAFTARLAGVPMDVPITINEAGLTLISRVQAENPDWKDWPDPYTLFGRPLVVKDNGDEAASCAIEGVEVPADRVEETVADLLD